MKWIASIRINGVIKTFNIEAITEWNARKIAHRLCVGLREKGKTATFVELIEIESSKEEFAVED